MRTTLVQASADPCAPAGCCPAKGSTAIPTSMMISSISLQGIGVTPSESKGQSAQLPLSIRLANRSGALPHLRHARWHLAIEVSPDCASVAVFRFGPLRLPESFSGSPRWKPSGSRPVIGQVFQRQPQVDQRDVVVQRDADHDLVVENGLIPEIHIAGERAQNWDHARVDGLAHDNRACRNRTRRASSPADHSSRT